MLINSLKPLEEITGGGMVALPRNWTIEPWLSAWSTAQIGVEPTGLRPYFMNSIMMAVPAVTLSTLWGAERLRADQVALPRRHDHLRADAVLLLHPVPDRADPDGADPRASCRSRARPGLILVHFVYGIGFTTLYFRNYYAAFPTNWCARPRSTGRASSRSSGASCCRPRGRSSRSPDLAVHQYLERLPLRRVLRQRRCRADDGGAQQPRQLLHRRAEYNVHFAGAIMAAAPTLLVYIVAGRYFVRGLMAGSVKG
jgi:glucose/mannose transport system permease protein